VSAAPDQTERLLAFEMAGALYALPIADVVEVTEVGPLSAVPMLPLAIGGVVNHHGDALLVLDGPTLLERPPGEARPTHLLVLARDPDDPARFGVPVEGIRGLVEGAAAPARGASPVAQLRPVGGRLMHVLDPRRLLERAQATVERSMSGPVFIPGGAS
jgi:chemotaxis signal transduction protein